MASDERTLLCLAPTGAPDSVLLLRDWGWTCQVFTSTRKGPSRVQREQASLLLVVPGSVPRVTRRELIAFLETTDQPRPGGLILGEGQASNLPFLEEFAGLAPIVAPERVELLAERLEEIIEQGENLRRREAVDADPPSDSIAGSSSPPEPWASAALHRLEDGVVVLGDTGEVLFLNDALRDHFGLPDDPATFTALLEQITQVITTHADVFMAAAQGLLEPASQTPNLTFDTIDQRAFAVTCAALPAEAGAPARRLCTFREITAQRELENRLAHTNRDASLASQAKTTFLSTLSHELRTPLNSIVGFAELLRENHQNDEEADYIDVISANTEALLALINQMLDLSRIEAGKIELNYETCAVEPFLVSVLQTFVPKARVKQLELAGFVAPEVPPVVVTDASRLRQILLNLLTNAIKFTEQGTVEILVESVASPQPTNPTLRFRVRDTGPGIPQSQTEEIFQPFSQLRPVGSREYGGSGLGLAISRELAQMMSGKLWAESEENYGASLVLEIEVEASAKPSAQPNLAHSVLRDRSVVLVDPVEANRRTARSLVTTDGVDLRVAAEWEELFDVLGTLDKPPEALLIDHQVMRPSPEEGLARLRERIGPDVPIALSFPGYVREPKEMVRTPDLFAQLVNKPVDRTQLRTILASLLRGDATETVTLGNHANEPNRVLLAEDDPDNRRLVRALLEPIADEVVEVENGTDAVTYLQRESFSVVVLDIRLPQTDGLDILRQLRAGDLGPRNRDVFVLAITARAIEANEEVCREAGANAYLAKPFAGERLQSILAPVLAR